MIGSDALRFERRETLGRVFDFLGVEPDRDLAAVGVEHHRTATKRVRRPIAQRLRSLPGYRALSHATPRPFRKSVSRLLHRSVDERKGLISDELRSYIYGELQEDFRILGRYSRLPESWTTG